MFKVQQNLPTCMTCRLTLVGNTVCPFLTFSYIHFRTSITNSLVDTFYDYKFMRKFTVTHKICFIILYACNIIFPLQLLLYEYHCKATLEYEKENPHEKITWISLELVMAEGNFLSKFRCSFFELFSILSAAYLKEL